MADASTIFVELKQRYSYMETRYLSLRLHAEEAQTLIALAVLSGKPERQILGEIVSAGLQRLDRELAAPLLSTTRVLEVFAKDLDDSRVEQARA